MKMFVGGFVVTCIGFSGGYLAAQHNLTPPPVPVVAGAHCWQEFNNEMPKHHELICMKDAS